MFTERSTRNLRRRADSQLGRNVSTLNYGSALHRSVLMLVIVRGFWGDPAIFGPTSQQSFLCTTHFESACLLNI